MFHCLFQCVIFTVLKLSLAEVCPGSWWYCLNRDPKEANQARAIDTSNRSISWAWETSAGRWDVGYQHSFPTGKLAVAACYTGYRDGRPCCVSYDSDRTWRSDGRPIPASVWDIAYNGDNFGFQPGPQGQYVFHIFSRNLHYNPWTANGGGGGIGGGGGEPGPVDDPMKNCKDQAEEQTNGNGWCLERKPPICPVTVSSGQMVSPMEWSWQTSAGRWKVLYRWGGGGGVNCSIYYAPSGDEKSFLITWKFDGDRLILDYSAYPMRIYREQPWKLKVSGGEAWGFAPSDGGSWILSVYSSEGTIETLSSGLLKDPAVLITFNATEELGGIHKRATLYII